MPLGLSLPGTLVAGVGYEEDLTCVVSPLIRLLIAVGWCCLPDCILPLATAFDNPHRVGVGCRFGRSVASRGSSHSSFNSLKRCYDASDGGLSPCVY